MTEILRKDQLAEGQHFKDMGGGWCIMSADFICAMAGVERPKPEVQKVKRISKPVKAKTTNWKRK